MTVTAPPRRLLLPVVLSATFVQLLSVTVAQVATPAIRADLAAGAGAGHLVLAGYTLAYACVLITAARLGDRWGYRRLFVIGTAGFALAATACAFAPTIEVLIAARLAQGVAAGLVAPQVFSLIQTALPAARRPRALGLLGATMAVASLTGPLLGGLLIGADLFGLGWRPVFLLPVPVALAALLGAVALPPGGAAGWPRVDWLGAALVTVGLGLLVLPLTVGPGSGWPPWTLGCLFGAGPVLVGCAWAQRRGPEPLIHPEVLRDRGARAGVGLVLVFNAGVPSFTYLLFLHVQSVSGYSATEAAVLSLPFAGAAIVGSASAVRLTPVLGRRLLTLGALLLAATMATLALTVGARPEPWTAVPALAVGGAAFGAFTASVFALVLARAAPETVGSVSGVLPTAQQLGGTLGIALATLAYAAPAATPAAAWRHAMLYETVVFLLAAALSLRLTRRPRPG
ncbi:MFS transporter [Streptomyces sp. NBRC 109706]|uniref:MFS transporter n=1 Tax=Streptomyces sp. NBRC 109706 TaxID=1550035 RepID=UPI000AA4B81C|nr:MFS transporter [Streptomyces sp. NBRC 109706]